jgi:hypothetical protein
MEMALVTDGVSTDETTFSDEENGSAEAEGPAPELGLEVIEPSRFYENVAPPTAPAPAPAPPAVETPVREPVVRPLSSRRSPRYRTVNEAQYTDEELARLFARMVQSKKCPEAPAREPLRDWADRAMRDCAAGHRYDEGARLRAGVALLEAFMAIEEKPSEVRRRNASEKLPHVQEQLTTKQMEWGTRIAEWQAGHDRRAAELEEQHRTKIEELERKWADPASLIEFAKPSFHAQVLRLTQQRLAAMKQFEGAKILQKEADRVEKSETDKAKEKAVVAMKVEYTHLLEQQQREIECMNEFRRRQTMVLEMERDAEVVPLEIICSRLEAIIKEPVIPERKGNLRFLTPPRPLPPRPFPRAGELRTPPETLPMEGIKLRQFIRVHKKGTSDKPKTKKKAKNGVF